ncbi:hypothetical protein [Nocardia tengchongensis]
MRAVSEPGPFTEDDDLAARGGTVEVADAEHAPDRASTRLIAVCTMVRRV